MIFNISQNIIVPTPAERTPKFPKVPSKSSLATQTEGYVQTEIVSRKITNEQKGRFIHLITNQNVNMKEASKQVGMSYSTAKKVFSRFRKTLKLKNSNKTAKIQNGLRCCYAQISSEELNPVGQLTVISTIAGRQQFKFYKE